MTTASQIEITRENVVSHYRVEKGTRAVVPRRGPRRVLGYVADATTLRSVERTMRVSFRVKWLARGADLASIPGPKDGGFPTRRDAVLAVVRGAR